MEEVNFGKLKREVDRARCRTEGHTNFMIRNLQSKKNTCVQCFLGFGKDPDEIYEIHKSDQSRIVSCMNGHKCQYEK